MVGRALGRGRRLLGAALAGFPAAAFAGGARADFNGSDVICVQDIFDFLAAYFAACP